MEHLWQDNCTRALDPDAILAGLPEIVKPCKALKELLKIDRQQLPLSTVSYMISLHLQTQENFCIPLDCIAHFSPHANVTKANWIDIIAHHCRYVYPKQNLFFVEQDRNLCEVRMIDFAPEEKKTEPIQIEFEGKNICTTCQRYFNNQNFQKHTDKGPFAMYHPCFSLNDDELTMLLGVLTYYLKGNMAVCRFCMQSYNLLYCTREITEHAQTHANYLLNPDLSMIQSKEQLWKILTKDTEDRMYTCLTCHRYFANYNTWYLHAKLFEHKMAKQFCTKCKKGWYGTLEGHMEHNHQNITTCPLQCHTMGENIIDHMLTIHSQFGSVVPEIEERKLRSGTIDDDSNMNKIMGIYGMVLINPQFNMVIHSLVTTAVYGSMNTMRYSYIDADGWKLANKMLMSRTNGSRLKRHLWPMVQQNPLRLATKTTMLQNMELSIVNREEHPTIANGQPQLCIYA